MLQNAVSFSLSKLSYILPIGILSQYWVIFMMLVATMCLIRSCHKWFTNLKANARSNKGITNLHEPSVSQSSPSYRVLKRFSLRDIFRGIGRHRQPINSALHSADLTNDMPHPHQIGLSKKTTVPTPRQPYEALLILDVEATCHPGTDFNFPNEIIEFPVCLLKWQDRSDDNRASQLEVIDEFRTFVKPTWRPTLSDFCKDLTGITQKQVDSAPLFPAVMEAFQNFMVKHGLLDGESGERLVRFCWCSDGPFDVRDFVVKQCFISKISMPSWLQGDVLDIRTLVLECLYATQTEAAKGMPVAQNWRRRSLNIPAQLKSLGLPGFEGRQHSGIDDSRNLARIIAELARRGVCLKPNTAIHLNRRWQWMGKHGHILEEYFPT